MINQILFSGSKDNLKDGYTQKDSTKYFKRSNLFSELIRETEKQEARNNLGVIDEIKQYVLSFGTPLKNLEEANKLKTEKQTGFYYFEDGSVLIFKYTPENSYQIYISSESIVKRVLSNNTWGDWESIYKKEIEEAAKGAKEEAKSYFDDRINAIFAEALSPAFNEIEQTLETINSDITENKKQLSTLNTFIINKESFIRLSNINEADKFNLTTTSAAYIINKSEILLYKNGGSNIGQTTQTWIKDGKLLFRKNIKRLTEATSNSSYWSDWEQLGVSTESISGAEIQDDSLIINGRATVIGDAAVLLQPASVYKGTLIL